MKKFAAISIIVLLVFNWYGYRFVTNLLTAQADQQLEARLDQADYNEEELIEVKIALNVPYQNVQSGFERHYGEVEVDGVFYTYVKSKVENGYLVLKCIPNESKQAIRQAGNDFYKNTNGLDQDQPGKKSDTQVSKASIGDFDDQTGHIHLEAYTADPQAPHAAGPVALYHTYSAVAGKPPQSFL